MRIDVFSCETSKTDPQIVSREKNGVTFYGLRMRFCECEGLVDHNITFWAKSIADLHVFTIVMQEKVMSHLTHTQSEEIERLQQESLKQGELMRRLEEAAVNV